MQPADDMFNPKSSPPATSKLFMTFTKLVVPSFLTNIMAFLGNTTTVVYAGQSNNEVWLAAIGLSNASVGIMMTSMLVGVNSAQETLSSQAFGANQLRLCGIYLNRGIMILNAAYLPLALSAGIFGEKILNALGQEPEVTAVSIDIIRIMLIAVFLWGHYDLRKRWLSCQRITFVPMIASFIATAVLVPACYIFMYTCNLGIKGIAVAAVVKEFTALAITVVYCYCKPEIRQVMQPHSCESFKGWGEYLALSIPATVMICAGWWAFELITFMSGMLGVLELSSQTVAIQCMILLSLLHVSFQEVVCSLIGNCIGANNVPLAKRFFKLTLQVMIVLIAICMATTITARRQVAKLFTSDEEVLEMAIPLILLVGVNFFADGLQGYF